MTNTSKLLIAIGLFVVVAGVAVYFLFIRSGGEGEAPATTAVAKAPAGEPAAPPTPTRTPAAPPEAAAKPRPEPVEPLTGSREPYRPDPFELFPKKHIPPPPPPPLFAGRIFAPVSLAQVPILDRDLVRPRLTRRVAGLLWDGRVWALYESRGQTSVVKPGDIVEGGMVQAITDDGLLLDVEGEPEPVVVPLARGALRPTAPAGTRPGVTPGLPGRPGLPGATTPVSGSYRPGGPPGVPAL